VIVPGKKEDTYSIADILNGSIRRVELTNNRGGKQAEWVSNEIITKPRECLEQLALHDDWGAA
jgi:hypothetical protein